MKRATIFNTVPVLALTARGIAFAAPDNGVPGQLARNRFQRTARVESANR
jgi:hypothetical protein